MFLENPEWFWKIQNDSGKSRMVLESHEASYGPGPRARVQGGRRPTFGPFYSGPGLKNIQKLGIKTFFGGVCVRKLPRIWILDILVVPILV